MSFTAQSQRPTDRKHWRKEWSNIGSKRDMDSNEEIHWYMDCKILNSMKVSSNQCGKQAPNI